MKRKITNRAEMELYIQRIKSMPEELKSELLTWEEIVRSPHSYSFYSSKQKRWNYTPRNCKRISNHWNFKGTTKSGASIVHCITDVPVQNNNCWTLATFEKGVWKVVKSIPI